MTSPEYMPLLYCRCSPRWRFWRDRFRLTHDYQRPIPSRLQSRVKGPVETRYLKIWQDDRGQWWLLVRARYQWDGASMVPTTHCAVLASLIHDVFYDYVVAVSVAWNVSRGYVRDFSDDWFEALLRDERSWARRIYPWGVRTFGGLWNEAGLIIRRLRGRDDG